MRNLYKLYIIIAILCIPVLFLFKSKYNLDKKKNIQKNIIKLPNAVFVDLDDRYNSLSTLNKNGICIVYFNPDCEHCEYEIAEILNRIDDFKKYTIVFISAGDKIQTQKFITQQRILTKPNVCVLLDKSSSFYNLFGTFRVPTIFIYNENSFLRANFYGEIKIEKILNAL